ncbi:helicase-exonuclease AddAB subunit AddA [Desulfitibacter alkalitolerans]|uniref:helicase-exonuclease AddAB subunit AddA n=1 Tax=Desulfitibacter alkalitolerans TaxID=264641 RepID=UPI00054E40D3|nr:helicase-exonuclease AddAB subunit AddA [Desulfitibacter alkalitolerans]
MSELTIQQQAVVEARDCNLLVSAGAGAGKTHTLVERIIQLVSNEQQPVDIDSLLVVTFTNAAAAEMRQRIGEAIAVQLRKGSSSKHLRRQMRLLNKSSISTIHSFCLDVIRQNFHQLELDPGFRIADELESDILKAQVVEKLLESYYDNDDADFLYLLECYGGQREDTPLQNMLLQVYSFAVSTPWPGKWLDGVVEGFSNDGIKGVDDYPWIDIIKDEITIELQRVREVLERALRIAKAPNGPVPLAANLEDDLGLVDDLLIACKGAWGELENGFQNLTFSRLKSCKGVSFDEDLKKSIQDLREEVKKSLKKIAGQYFYRTEEEFLRDMSAAAPLIKKLVELVKAFGEEYKRAKLSKGLLDFGDLEHYCLEILAEHKDAGIMPSQAARDLRKKFLYVLVDEYQDINEVQETILQLVCREAHEGPNLLMVGDAKQSIYRFRLAEPTLFQGKQQSFSTPEGSLNRKIDLTKNFRSRAEVIHGVNFIFRQIMTPYIGEMEYTSAAELVYGAAYPEDEAEWDRSVELLLIDRDEEIACSDNTAEALDSYEDDHESDKEQEDVSDEEELEVSQGEARAIARKIQGLISQAYPVFDKRLKGYRPLEYRDIVILLRAARGWSNAFLEEFRQRDIPAYAELSSGYFEAVEVNTIMSLLRIIDNPRQDIPLAAVLRSPIAGLTAEELAAIRLNKKDGEFYEAVIEAAREDNALGNRLKAVLQKLERWRTMARRGSLSRLLWKVYGETGYLDFVGGLPGGQQRQANLRALHDRARQYESLNFRGLSRFLQFIETFLEKGKDLGEARSMGERENLVRIMSIHKSKGLEFPVVFVAGLGKQFNIQDLNKDILLHKKFGLGPELVDSKLRFKLPTLAKVAIKKKIHRESLAEEMRILYVALTRAKEKLILVGSAKTPGKTISKWEQILSREGWQLSDGSLAGARNFLDWLIPALLRHKNMEKLRSFLSADDIKNIADTDVYNDPSCWKCFLITRSDLGVRDQAVEASNTKILEKIKNMEVVDIDSIGFDDVEALLSWKYPFEAAVARSAVVSVTEAKGLFQEDDFLIYSGANQGSRRKDRPGFLQGSEKPRELTPVEYGSLTHKVMQHLDLEVIKENLGHEAIGDQVELMVKKEILTAREAELVKVHQVLEFFQSPLGVRILKADEVKREVIFTLAVPASAVYEDEAKSVRDVLKDECVLIRGIIDCLFYEEDGAVVVDYKTDYADHSNLAEKVNTYRSQLNLYAEAVERILKIPVKEKYLYFLSIDRAIAIS